MTDPALDMSWESMDATGVHEPRDPSTWLGRRSYGFGASEAHALLVICGKRFGDTAPRWMLDEYIRETKTRWGTMPFLLARKAGLRRATKPTSVTRAGTERERDVVAVWRETAHEITPLIDAASIRHTDDVPTEWMPIVDRECPQLTCTPDAWARDVISGDLVDVQIKCSTESYGTRYGGAPPHVITQLCATNACTGGRSSLLIEGVQWSADWRADGPVVAWPVERDDSVIADVRECARQCWERVRQVRALREAEV